MVAIGLCAINVIAQHQERKSYDAYVSCLKNQNQLLKELLKSVCKQESDKGGDDKCSQWDL